MTILFKKFIETNAIELKQLPSLLQEKISLFGKLYDILKEIQEPELAEQQKELTQQLEELDYEILVDIEEELQDDLNHNDRLEESVEKNTTPKLKTDISIIKELIQMGRKKDIKLNEFKEMGLQTKLGWRTNIGEFTLKRNSLVIRSYDIIEA